MEPQDGTEGQASDGLRKKREALLSALDREITETAKWTGVSALSPEVRQALLAVPRHRFVAPEYRDLAYQNRPLPIGSGQTISQPYIVALMTELARPGPSKRVLEVGTGCGYQAAVLAEVFAKVFTIEAIPSLADSARKLLDELGYTNVIVRTGDGSHGWPEDAPFDAIMVTAAAQKGVEKRLAEQLVPGGRLVIPVQSSQYFGAFGPGQELKVLAKTEDGRTTERGVLPVAFVPLIGGTK